MRHLRPWGFASAGLAMSALLLVGAASPALAICNPGRPHTILGSQYQIGLEDVAPGSASFTAGANLWYYTPYVQQDGPSSSSAWQLVGNQSCTYQGGYPALAQGGFSQLPGDSYDKVFVEYGPCNGSLGPDIELPSSPRVNSRFNVSVAYTPSLTAMAIYQGSTLLLSANLYGSGGWSPQVIEIGAEVHNENDQGYGGYNLWAQQEFTGLAFAYGNTPYGDILYLDHTESWLGIAQGSQGFSTYDTACPT